MHYFGPPRILNSTLQNKEQGSAIHVIKWTSTAVQRKQQQILWMTDTLKARVTGLHTFACLLSVNLHKPITLDEGPQYYR